MAIAALATSAAAQNADRLEQVVVTAKHTRTAWNNSDSPLGAPLSPADSPVPVSSLADLARQQPGIAYAGQGGLLQVIAIRGISGQQVANFWGDIPILSERRAGTSSSFIDPLMLAEIEILRGPSSVYYGNGAVAGVVQMTPARPRGLEAELQWQASGDENLQYLGWGNGDVSLAASRRSANDSQDAKGSELNTGYDQYNAQLVWDFELAGQQLALQTLYSEGRDIGKSSNQYPDERIADYPSERHWLGELVSTLPGGSSGSLFYHYQELDTRVERPGDRVNRVADQALDFGLRLTSGWRGQDMPVRFGLDYLGRRDVEARERELDLETSQSTHTQTLDAQQDNLDIYADTYRQFASLELAAGVRWAYTDQRARGFADTDDSAISAFLRTSWEATPALNLSLELASGVRFAGLSERYFSGTTGRGQVLGNPALDPEDTLGVDLGLRWSGQAVQLELHLYGMQIDDYIERVDISDDLRSFRNLTQGDIYGLEGAAEWALTPSLYLVLGAHYIKGEDSDGTTLANISPPRLSSGLRYERGNWRTSLDFDYRFSESDVAPGEVPVDSAGVLEASIAREFRNGLNLSLWGRNLLDASWRLSTDELATRAPERSIGVTLSWRNDANQAPISR